MRPTLESVESVGGTDADASEIVSVLGAALSERSQAVGGSGEEDTTGADNGSPLGAVPALPSPQEAQEALELALELAPGVQLAAVRFGSSLLSDAADRLGALSQASSQPERK